MYQVLLLHPQQLAGIQFQIRSDRQCDKETIILFLGCIHIEYSP